MTMLVVHSFYQVTQNEASPKSGPQVLQNSNSSRNRECRSKMIGDSDRPQNPGPKSLKTHSQQDPNPRSSKLRPPETPIPEPRHCKSYPLVPQLRAPKGSNPLLLKTPPGMLLKGIDSLPRSPDPVHDCWHLWGRESLFLISPFLPWGLSFPL